MLKAFFRYNKTYVFICSKKKELKNYYVYIYKVDEYISYLRSIQRL